MTKIANHDEVRFVRGKTVDTDHVAGGDLKGCRAKVISPPYDANGTDGEEGEKLVLLSVNDDKAPRYAGLVSAPVRNLERVTASTRRASGSGIGPGRWSRKGQDPIQLRRKRAKERKRRQASQS